MNIFDIMGPIMVGPSSSHTAGAARIGYVSRQLLGEDLKKAEILLHGSFAATGKGHGTDKAIVAGLMGMMPDDERIPDAFEIAKEKGIEISVGEVLLKTEYANACLLNLESVKGRSLSIVAASLGGGRISIEQIDGIDTHFSGDYPTLIVHNLDQPGHVAEVTSTLAHKSVNIATLNLYRDKRGGYAVMIVETDQDIPETAIKWIEHLEGIIKVTYINIEK
ncbi:L-serine ammonia-lyase, iron-sulfur-dependent subunit beta [Lachnospira pectinoschiza]|uniref:L-serine deaminase n=1 Tax=Lachnospira pectinoschiza TaxID=28052 RepID=A0A1G9TNJ0_9FIRM|nr:L-serine ammonia-lyase, iron-sulfur-dependent subunit beta [Lachnospira pectinoschiza]SDM49260.1 L-serine dehydratase [Lachnospira pectinoschiza]